MANLQGFGIDGDEEFDDAPFAPLPVGVYKVVAHDSELKDTKSGGKMLAVTFEIVEGPHTSRKLFANFNLVNKSDRAVEIAKRELASFAKAVGVPRPDDSEELHFKPVMVRVVQEADRDGVVRNRIKSYSPADGAPSAAPSTRSTATQTQSEMKLPWQR